MIGSAPWHFSWEELYPWAKKQLPFFALFLAMFLQQVQSGKSLQEALIWAQAWLLNITISFLMKLSQDKREIYP